MSTVTLKYCTIAINELSMAVVLYYVSTVKLIIKIVCVEGVRYLVFLFIFTFVVRG